jgi:cyclopropane-fatty-acyl-phospholipid synthase
MNLDPIVRAVIAAMERGRLPDSLIRAGIRRLIRRRLHSETRGDARERQARREAFIAAMDAAPIAPLPQAANAQHYEVPPAFFEAALGPRLKYSSCLWPPEVKTLAAAEQAALAATCAHAGLVDGARILELGCGWGSLTLWMAEKYPASQITAVSNSALQRDFILARAEHQDLRNIEVIMADMNDFATTDRFDRIVSVEMFEHMRNWRKLLRRIHGWLAPGGQLLVHVFCHREQPWEFVAKGESDWMSRHFFTGGIMPSEDLILAVRGPLEPVDRWRWSGTHYARSAEAWLANLERNRKAALAALRTGAGDADAPLQLQRWRIFFMACAEVFAYNNGNEWGVVHHLMTKNEK